MLDFNMNGEVWGRIIDKNGKLQIFLITPLHEEHDLNDPDILPSITVFKLTAAAETLSTPIISPAGDPSATPWPRNQFTNYFSK